MNKIIIHDLIGNPSLPVTATPVTQAMQISTQNYFLPLWLCSFLSLLLSIFCLLLSELFPYKLLAFITAVAILIWLIILCYY